MGTISDIFGKKPTLPPWQTLDLGAEQGKAVANNLAIAPEASRLANLTEDQLLSMLRKAIPNWDQISGTASGNIEALLKGEIPADVTAQVQKSAASEALFGGYGGTGMSRNLTARDLGLTSLSLTEKGLGQAESWMAASERLLSPAAAVYTNMFVTPGEQAAFDTNERDKKFEHDWLGSQIEAMPDPVASGLMHQFDGTTLLGRNAPQQTGQQTPGTDPARSDGNNWASGWQTADDGGVTERAMASGASDASVGAAASGASGAGLETGLEGILGSGF